MSDLTDQFAMKPSDALTLLKYMEGKVSCTKSENAFLSSFRDPRWMMRWSLEHYDSLSKFAAWQRQPAQKCMATLENALEQLQSLRGLYPTTSDGLLGKIDWSAEQDALAIKIVHKVGDISEDQLDAAQISHFCPGITTAARVLISTIRASTAAQKARKLKRSDFLDAIHAMHAPYVTLYRTDRTMSPVVTKHTSSYGTEVVSKLPLLPGRIRELVRKKGDVGN